jgi:hypothetical protein
VWDDRSEIPTGRGRLLVAGPMWISTAAFSHKVQYHARHKVPLTWYCTTGTGPRDLVERTSGLKAGTGM